MAQIAHEGQGTQGVEQIDVVVVLIQLLLAPRPAFESPMMSQARWLLHTSTYRMIDRYRKPSPCRTVGSHSASLFRSEHEDKN